MTKALNKETTALVEQLKPLFKIEGTDVVVDKEAYKKTLPTGVTIEMAEELSQHNSRFYAAAASVGGHLAIDVMADNADLKEVSVSVPTTNDSQFEFTVDRVRTFPGTKFGGTDSGPTTKHGYLQPTLISKEARMSIGQMAAVKTNLGLYGAEKLADAALEAMKDA
jgi:hypothetical protein